MDNLIVGDLPAVDQAVIFRAVRQSGALRARVDQRPHCSRSSLAKLNRQCSFKPADNQ
jgi:hypothetical protein